MAKKATNAGSNASDEFEIGWDHALVVRYDRIPVSLFCRTVGLEPDSRSTDMLFRNAGFKAKKTGNYRWISSEQMIRLLTHLEQDDESD